MHLYDENPIVLDIDTPLEEFGGLTAFQVSQRAFRHHKSQHWTWFYEWLYGKNDHKTSSSQIRTYHPNRYGLYFSRVGEDIEKNCMLENVTLYRDREIIIPDIPESDSDIATKPTKKLTTPTETQEGSSLSGLTLIIFAVLILALITAILITKKKR